MLLHPMVKEKMHLQEITLFDHELGVTDFGKKLIFHFSEEKGGEKRGLKEQRTYCNIAYNCPSFHMPARP